MEHQLQVYKEKYEKLQQRYDDIEVKLMQADYGVLEIEIKELQNANTRSGKYRDYYGLIRKRYQETRSPKKIMEELHSMGVEISIAQIKRIVKDGYH